MLIDKQNILGNIYIQSNIKIIQNGTDPSGTAPYLYFIILSNKPALYSSLKFAR